MTECHKAHLVLVKGISKLKKPTPVSIYTTLHVDRGSVARELTRDALEEMIKAVLPTEYTAALAGRFGKLSGTGYVPQKQEMEEIHVAVGWENTSVLELLVEHGPARSCLVGKQLWGYPDATSPPPSPRSLRPRTPVGSPAKVDEGAGASGEAPARSTRSSPARSPAGVAGASVPAKEFTGGVVQGKRKIIAVASKELEISSSDSGSDDAPPKAKRAKPRGGAGKAGKKTVKRGGETSSSKSAAGAKVNKLEALAVVAAREAARRVFDEGLHGACFLFCVVTPESAKRVPGFKNMAPAHPLRVSVRAPVTFMSSDENKDLEGFLGTGATTVLKDVVISAADLRVLWLVVDKDSREKQLRDRIISEVEQVYGAQKSGLSAGSWHGSGSDLCRLAVGLKTGQVPVRNIHNQ